MSGPKALGAVGFAVPLNIFLFQEIARMQNVFNIVRKTLNETCDAIDGQIIMNPDILDSIMQFSMPECPQNGFMTSLVHKFLG